MTVTRQGWLSYSCLGKDSDHGRCTTGPDRPSPQGIAPVCTCPHHDPDYIPSPLSDIIKFYGHGEFGTCWCESPRHAELEKSTGLTTVICEQGHEAS